MDERGVVRKDDGIWTGGKCVPRCVSAEKYRGLRNKRNDAPPFLAALANHEINTGSQVFGACYELPWRSTRLAHALNLML